MSAKLRRIEAALEREGLRSYVDAIDDNPATRGEVVLWISGVGVAVYSVREATKKARRAKQYDALGT